jgi:DNA-damage-inducible protein D
MNNIKLFEEKKVRTFWDEDQQQWFFSVIDVVQVLPEV